MFTSASWCMVKTIKFHCSTGNSLQLHLVLLLATEITHFIFRLYKIFKQAVEVYCQTNDDMFFHLRFQGQTTPQYMRSFLLNCPYCQCPCCWTSALHGLKTHMVVFVLQEPQALLALLQLQTDGAFLFLYILILLPEARKLCLDLLILRVKKRKRVETFHKKQWA